MIFGLRPSSSKASRMGWREPARPAPPSASAIDGPCEASAGLAGWECDHTGREAWLFAHRARFGVGGGGHLSWNAFDGS